jgi:transcriptional regulator with XRE-family HTH domain
MRTGAAKSHPRDAAVRAAFARVLLELRERRGLTQEVLGFESGYHPKYIGLLERRRHTPTLTAVIEISRALGVTPSWLVDRVRKLLPQFRRTA